MKRTNTLPYFQIDSGQLLLTSMGHSLEEMGLYLLLMAIYWEGDCRLPPREALIKKLKMKGKKLELLDQVIDEMFPGGVSTLLDQQRANALKTSVRNSANARKRYVNPQESSGNSEKPLETTSDPNDF